MFRFTRTCATVGALFAVGPAVPAHATMFIVNKTADTLDGACNHDCSLREAIVAANDSPGPDVVLLGPDAYNLTLAGAGEDAAATGDLDVLDDLVLIGEGAGQSFLDGFDLDRVLHVHEGATVEVRDVTIRRGRVTGNGGGILNAGRLKISRSFVAGNQTIAGQGGGIYSGDASLTITESTIYLNESDGSGGGIAAGGQMTLANVTVSTNVARVGDGGGIYALADLDGVINNTTITINSASHGGGIFAESSPFIAIRFPHVRNSILADNFGPHPEDRDCSGAVASDGFNLLGIGDACIDFGPDKNDKEGTAAAPLDARLNAPVGLNGGPTFTHSLLTGSPAINAGSPAAPGSGGASCEPVDQRGVARTGHCDIGAFEAAASGCVEGAWTLCLQDDRFEVTATFRTRQDLNSPALVVELTPDSGYFLFFGPHNVEVVVKVLNGCAANNRFWVFIAGMTDVEVAVTVKDTVADMFKTYINPLGQPFEPVLDTTAFPSCSAR